MRLTLSQQYAALLRDYTLFPNAGSIISLGGGKKLLAMLAIPNGNTKPIWWGTDGNSYFIFMKLYAIVD